ncbi:MAG: galactosyltransferase-related protein [Cyclonatronaceae bacterium]
MIDKKLSLKELTIYIRVKIDSVDRLENLQMVTKFICDHLESNVQVIETGCYDNGILNKILPDQVEVTFIEDYDTVYHYTRHFNTKARFCKTSFLALWDADVIVPIQQIHKAFDLLQRKEADFVIPYMNQALDTSPILREIYYKTRDINVLMNNMGKMREMYMPNPVGGCFICNSNLFIKAGMENEKFYGWGREDGERVNRWEVLGYRLKRVLGPLFHLTHERKENSWFHSSDQDSIKLNEIYRIHSMSKEELLSEINTWE